jgi:hypothetical protein
MQPATLDDFTGLDLRSDSVGGAPTTAIDALNCALDKPGVVRTRPGYATYNSVAYSSAFRNVRPFYHFPNANYALVGTTTVGALVAYDELGAVQSSYTGAGQAARGQSWVQMGGAGSTDIWLITADPNGALISYNGSTWSSTSFGAIPPALVGHLPWDNRLVRVAASGSRLDFSDPGAPFTYGANNYVLLTPNDGEAILGTATWQNFFFAFKQSKFFVFYATDTDATGSPIFRYRTVYCGPGKGVWHPYTPCVAPEGVYYVGHDGIYLTRGDQPTYVSEPIRPFFERNTNSFWTGGTYTRSYPGRPDYATSEVFLSYALGRLWCSVPIESGGRLVFLYDTRTSAWSAYNWPANQVASFHKRDDEERIVFAATNANHLMQSRESDTTDNGAAIVSRYRSAFSDYGSPNLKTVRDTDLWGTGTVNLAWSHDFGSLATADQLTLGSSPAIKRGRHRRARQGTFLSFQLSASSGRWAVHRMVPHLQAARVPGAFPS